MNAFELFIYFNMHIICSMFFSTGIALITKVQESELKKIYKIQLLRKLGLSKKFLYKILYALKNSLRVRLLQLRIIIVMSTIR